MKTERENYFKPQTIMEQVAMEQGICAASIISQDVEGITSKGQDYHEFDATVFDGKNANGGWEIEWK
jgi:hypothetical protein